MTIRIPPHWTPEEALLMVSFLEALADAIWQLYAWDMARWIQQEYGWEDITEAINAYNNLRRTPIARPIRHEER